MIPTRKEVIRMTEKMRNEAFTIARNTQSAYVAMTPEAGLGQVLSLM